jgi:octaprenyl-diphosphate synthase
MPCGNPCRATASAPPAAIDFNRFEIFCRSWTLTPACARLRVTYASRAGLPRPTVRNAAWSSSVRVEGPAGTLSLNALYAPIVDDLARSQAIFADEMISDQGFISDLCGHVRQFHGKLLRPALLLLTARACGNLTPEHHTLAAVVELVHIATLVHDDVLDEADIRRRAATVNRLWGNGRAVLMGDLLYSHAFHLCSSLESQFASRLIGATAITVCEGEMMQVANRGNLDLSEPEYLDIITRKTAVLVEACCHLGAKFAHAGEETVRALREFGRASGVAFQVVDDLLDLTGDESEVGKSLGRDLSEGELTLPLIHYLRTAPARQRTRLVTLLRSAEPQNLAAIADLLRDSQSIAYARDFARDQIAAAQQALASLPDSPARASLGAMADFVITRRG